MSKYSLFSGLSIVILMVLEMGCGSGQRFLLVRAHAHNDYEHARPLLDALDYGFCSVEADVHLVEGKLLVAHDAEDVEPGRTLQKLYLDPLRDRIRENRGRVYPGGPEFLLWIDVKTDGRNTYMALHDVLQQYADILTVVRDGEAAKGGIQVIISGNRAPEIMLAQKIRYAAVDGRLTDIESEAPVHFMPWISESAEKVSTGSGEGPILPSDWDKLSQLVRKVHERGRKVRLWGTPDEAAVWGGLLNAGVDLLNTDDLRGLRDFLVHRTCDPGGAG